MARPLSIVFACLLVAANINVCEAGAAADMPAIVMPGCADRAGLFDMGKTMLVAPASATKDASVSAPPQDMAGGYSTVIMAVKPTEMNDDVMQFEASCKTHGMPIVWMNSYSFPDAEAMTAMNIKPETVVMYLQNVADMVMVGSPEAMKANLKQSGKQIMMGMQFSCRYACDMNWPKRANRFVFANPEMMLGYASSMLALFTEASLREGASGMDRVASVFMDEAAREKLKMDMDADMSMMMTLENMEREMGLAKLMVAPSSDDQNRLIQMGTNFMPAIVRGDGNFMLRNQIGNYMVGPVEMMDSATMMSNKLFVMLIIEDISPFMELVLKSLADMTYPKNNMVIECFLEPRGPNYQKNKALLNTWMVDNAAGYAGVNMRDIMTVRESMMTAMTEAASWGADYFMLTDSLSRLTSNSTLQQLMALNKSIVSPLLSRSGRLWSNFWGAMTDEIDFAECRDMHPSCAQWSSAGRCSTTGSTCMMSCNSCPALNTDDMDYVSSFDFKDIVEGTLRGVWAVPMVFGTMMIKAAYMPKMSEVLQMMPDNTPSWRAQILMSRFMQQRHNTHVNIANDMFYGRYINIDSYVAKTHADLFMMVENPEEWEEKYLNEDYYRFRELGLIPGCNDVFAVPIVSPKFCKDLIAECEEFGSWSGGAYSDPRLTGGYEPVPTDDIHLRQLGMDTVWYNILTKYVRPVAAHHFVGYHLEGQQTLDFVVKYNPARQAALRPHHDASTVTLNVALNQGGVEYQGGGTHFIRQNCTFKDTTPGWGALFPGRLTHQHEGLRTTEGTRYILVSFIDQ